MGTPLPKQTVLRASDTRCLVVGGNRRGAIRVGPLLWLSAAALWRTRCSTQPGSRGVRVSLECSARLGSTGFQSVPLVSVDGHLDGAFRLRGRCSWGSKDSWDSALATHLVEVPLPAVTTHSGKLSDQPRGGGWAQRLPPETPPTNLWSMPPRALSVTRHSTRPLPDLGAALDLRDPLHEPGGSHPASTGSPRWVLRPLRLSL